ncbi:MAG TPA: FecR domain-containing protein [Phycisphaerales bacterium]|nr:FecR domain-containing protein [Phycisphaerales bacterium]
MNRATAPLIAALAGISLSASALAQQAQAPADPKKPLPPGAAPGAVAKPKGPVKPAIVDLQDAARQPRKRTPRLATAPAAKPQPAVAPTNPVSTPAKPAAALVEPLTPIVPPVAPKPPLPAVEQPAVAAPTIPDPSAPNAAAAPSSVEPGAATPPSSAVVLAPAQEPRTEPASSAEPVPTAGPHVSIIPAPTAPAEPGIAPATPPAYVGTTVDIESVAVKPAKGELRRSPIDLGAQEPVRSARQPVPAPSADQTVAAPTPAEPPAKWIPVQHQPDPAVSGSPLASAPVQSSLSPSLVEKWANERVAPAAPVTPAKTPEAAQPAKPSAAVTEPDAPEVEPVLVAPPSVVEKQPEPIAAVPTALLKPNSRADVKPPIESAPATAPNSSTPEPDSMTSKPTTEPGTSRPADVRPAAEPLPPAPSVPPVASRPDATRSVEPAAPAGLNVGGPKVQVTGPDVPPVDVSKVKLPGARAAGTPTAEPPATIESPPTKPAAPVVEPVADAIPTPTAPAPSTAPTVAASVKTGSPEPVSLKVLTLTGTPGMVQWQVDGGTQWLIPEIDETTKARFVVRTGPDAGVEVLADDSTRVRMGRFSRAELRTVETTDDAGTGKRLNVSLLRGVLYVVPGKGKVITVQTPQRTVIVKEPMQVTHDNGGTRSVSFSEQPNPGTTATAPSANP